MSSESEFFKWYETIQQYKDNYNLRMAFDAGYRAALKELEDERTTVA